MSSARINISNATRDELVEFLTSNGASYESVFAMNDDDMKAYAMKKRRRLLKGENENNEGAFSAMSLRAFQEVVNDMNKEGNGVKSFFTIVAHLRSIEGKIIVPRHTDTINGCKGIVSAGTCAKCSMRGLTPTWCFQMRLCLTDLDDQSVNMEMMAYSAMAKYFFPNMTPFEVRVTGVRLPSCRLVYLLARRFRNSRVTNNGIVSTTGRKAQS